MKYTFHVALGLAPTRTKGTKHDSQARENQEEARGPPFDGRTAFIQTVRMTKHPSSKEARMTKYPRVSAEREARRRKLEGNPKPQIQNA